MILGTYPCCDGELTLEMPNRTPAFVRHECPHCQAKVWTRFSVLKSITYTEEQFDKEFLVVRDEQGIVQNIIPNSELQNAPSESVKQLNSFLFPIIARAVGQMMANEIIGVRPESSSTELVNALRTNALSKPDKSVTDDPTP